MSSVIGSRLVNVFGVDELGLSWPEADLSRERLGGKGYGLARMSAAGLPVPPGFTLPTQVCSIVGRRGWNDDLTELVDVGIAALERATGKRLGDETAPLLVSVRSGAAESMPGMMDTVLDVGMTDVVEEALASASGDVDFAVDTHRRFLISFAEVVGGLDREVAARLWSAPECASADGLRRAISEAGVVVPDEPRDQILESLHAVFRSWNSPRARAYRDKEGIDHDLGTAATVQAMVFGNLGDDSGTGVAFTRCPSTGEPGLIGDFLVCAQGEDVVAGTHETAPLEEMKDRWPGLYADLERIGAELELDAADMMDIEFTIERGTLWVLQARVAKRSPAAVFQSAVDMAEDPSFPVDRAEALRRCAHLLDTPPTRVDDTVTDGQNEPIVVVTTGIAASPGRASGVLCVDVSDAVRRGGDGEAVVLVRNETSPADVHGMAAAVALVTALGGLVSHAAVVARAWGLPAVVGASDVVIDDRGITCGPHRVDVGTAVTVDGTTGQLILGRHGEQRSVHPAVETIRTWLETVPSPAEAVADEVTLEVAVLERALVLKGLATADALGDVIGADARPLLDELHATGRVEPKGTMWKPAEETVRRHRAADAEFVAAHGSALDAVLDRFNDSNARYKQLVTDWQIRVVDDEQVPNDHSDAAYDSAVLGRLDEIHGEVTVVLAEAAGLLPRLSDYRWRLDRARERLRGGDQRYMAHPLLDSYHTVWFELHEEFIRLTGRNRAAEAAAGRA